MLMQTRCMSCGAFFERVDGTAMICVDCMASESTDLNGIDRVSHSFDWGGGVIKLEEPISDRHVDLKLRIAIEALRFYYENRVRLGIDGGAAMKALILCGEDPKQRRKAE